MKKVVLSVVGVAVAGLPLGDVDAGTAASLRRLLADYGVLIMPGQKVDDAHLTAFLRQFGDLAFTAGETPVSGFPDLNVISNAGRRTPPRSVFHVDTRYVRRPPAYTALRAVTLPARGGETLFTNQYRAYETLPAEVHATLAGRTIRHVVTGLDLGGVASYYDALAKPRLEPYCEVLHGDADMIAALDDKYAFSVLAASLGLTVPDAHRICDPRQVEDFDFSAARPPYILKSIAYDPVHRLDLTTLPRPSRAETAAVARSKPISAATPWIMQGLARGREYCAHSTVRDGRVQVYCCCESSAFQVNYEMADKPEIEAWVRGFVEPLKLTGQFSFDFIQAGDGHVYAIECNPRTHSAITMFYDHPGLARAYLDDDVPVIEPAPGSRPTYWIYHEAWRLVTEPGNRLSRLKVILRGKDAIFDWADPLPFLMAHHLQIPWLLAGNLLRRKDWIRIDFNIGKLVEPDGD